MRRPWWSALILAAWIVGVAVGAGEHDELERNRRLLERWRADPDHYARLQRDLRAFCALPLLRRQQLRLLDHQLHAADGPTQTRLGAVLERYNAWLEALTDEQRQHILQAPDEATRLARIRDQRLREWLPRLPTKEQEVVRRLPADQQPDRIATFRFEERRQRVAWHRDWLAVKATIPRPTKMSELPPQARAFVQNNVIRHLTVAESKSLASLEGTYPDWLGRIFELSERHPVLPPGPAGEIKTLEDLSKVPGAEPVARRLKNATFKAKNQWPEFALAVHRNIPKQVLKFPPLVASKPSEFSKEIQTFLNKDLLPKLNNPVRTSLEDAQGKWPDYPWMLHRLARERRLIIPGMSLPGPVEMWENVQPDGVLPPIPKNRRGPFVRDGQATKKDGKVSSP